jgi:hypothetical protein
MVDAMAKIADRLHTVEIERVHGPAAVSSFRLLIDAVRRTYMAVPCERMSGGVTFYISIDPDVAPSPGRQVYDLSRQPTFVLTQGSIQVLADGRIGVSDVPLDFSTVAATAIGYRFEYRTSGGCVEQVLVGTDVTDVANATGFPSAFAIPTFDDLRDALEKYGQMVLEPTSPIAASWRDDQRLAFLPKPERHMRRALETYLRHALRDGRPQLRPEQNVNETNPVDIEVSWPYGGRLAWIEIKWLGYSGNKNTRRWTTPYREPRALEGLHQLKNYVESGLGRVSIPVAAYLVVFDARRHELKATETSISQARGMYYEFRDIPYPAATLEMTELEQPVRYFLRPICSGSA